jgi:hypothetical protein
MGGSEFDLYALVHSEFPNAESGKSFVSSPTFKDILVFAWYKVINVPMDDLSLLYLCYKYNK